MDTMVEELKTRLRKRLDVSRTARLERGQMERILAFQPPWVPPTEAELGRKEWSYAAVCKALLCRDWSHAHFEKQEILKALGPQTWSGGGVLVPMERDTEIIKPLYAKAVALKLGVPRRPMKSSSLTLPRIDSSTAAAWGYASEQRAESTNPAFGDVQLIAKDLWVMLYVERNLVMDSDPNVDIIIKEDGTRILALKLDEGFFLGSGTAPEPLGLINDPDINEPDSSGVTAALLSATNVRKLITAVQNDNGDGTGFATTPQVWHHILELKDGSGRFIAGVGDLTKDVPKTILGYPVELSTQLKNTAGTTHYLVFGDFKGQAVIGERAGVQIRVSEHFRFDRNQVAIMIDGRFDCRLKQPTAFAKLDVTSVTTL